MNEIFDISYVKNAAGKMRKMMPGMVEHASNPSTQDTEAGSS
jgi:hypothetical protein